MMVDLNSIQFQYREPQGMGDKTHVLYAKTPDGQVAGDLRWNAKAVQVVDVRPEFRRQGIATSLWQEGHRTAGETKSIPKPKHSNDRTNDGDAWARKVGGTLPRNRRFE